MVGCTYGGNLKNGCTKLPFSLRKRTTPSNDWGNGNLIFLDRHALDCGDDAINKFHLRRPAGNRINYNYECLEGVNSSKSGWKYTGTQPDGGGNTIFLDRHNVNCGDKPIVDFKLQRPSGNTIRYAFKCSNRKAEGVCRDLNTGWNQESAQNIYLDRHNVTCAPNEAITRFQLKRDGKGKFRYDYKCCAM
jgi:hypothetical protein